jgi:hypothetical protein
VFRTAGVSIASLTADAPVRGRSAGAGR